MRQLDKVINLLKKMKLILSCHCTYSHDTHSHSREPLFYCLTCKGRGWFWRKDCRPYIIYNSAQGVTSIRFFRIFSLIAYNRWPNYIKLFKWEWSFKHKNKCKCQSCGGNSKAAE